MFAEIADSHGYFLVRLRRRLVVVATPLHRAIAVGTLVRGRLRRWTKFWGSICSGSAALRITARNESMNTSLGLVASTSVTMAARTFSSPSARSSSPRCPDCAMTHRSVERVGIPGTMTAFVAQYHCLPVAFLLACSF